MAFSKSNPASIYFINSDLQDVEELIASIPDGAKVVKLDASGNGLQQMLDSMEGLSDVAAIHVLSHGEPGALMLGDQVLDSAALSENAELLDQFGSHLAESADVLLYGCDLASTDEGRQFVHTLSNLTGADVAASTDLTGQGGDWDLEYHQGSIEALSLSSFDLTSYTGTLALPGAHSATQGSEVFIGGNYIELGISSVGSFGTSGSAPSGFFGTARDSRVGMSNDADGFGNGSDLRIDYFLPGSPEERWAIGYNGGTYGGYSNLTGQRGVTLSDTSVTNNSAGDNLSATFSARAGGTLDVTQVHTFGVNDKYFKTTVTLTNVTGSALTDVRFMRSFDPDNTVYKGGSYSTVNKIENTYGVDGKSVVSATSQSDSYSSEAGSTAKILFFSSDPNAYVANFGFSNSNPYAAPEQAKGYTSTSDSAIAIVFKAGTMAAGASVTFEYFTSLDTADIATTVAAIEAASNPAPTFTNFAAPIDTVDEDLQVELTFAELAAQGDEADQQPDDMGGLVAGTVDAFVVTSVTSGTLLIGANAGSATAWNPGTNDVIDGMLNAYWTPGANDNGTLNAFKVVARDSDGLKSSTPITAQVTVNAVNDAPTFTSAASLTAINEDITNVANTGQTVDAIFSPRFQDVDGTFAGVAIVGDASDAVNEGAWQYSTDGGTNWFAVGMVGSASGLLLEDTALLRFVPVAHYNGTPGGLTVHAVDNGYAGSFTAGNMRQTVDTDADAADSGVAAAGVGVSVSVSAVNDLPTFTSVQGAASLTETSAWDNSVTTASGALTGTLTGTDQEDVVENMGSVSFSIRGGTTAMNTVTKQGFFGTLALDTTNDTWTYTPNNFTAINALAQGATATDNFEFKVYDVDGGSAIQTLTITLTGTNDLPVLASSISDQTFSGAGSWSFQVPSDSFTDAEGLGLTYTAHLVTDGGGLTLVGDGSLPGGLAFDEGTRTFSGDPSTDGTYFIRVTATDSAGAAVTDVFQLDFSNVGNQPPVVANPVMRYGADSREFNVTFSASMADETVTFDGVNVDLTGNLTAEQVATAVAAEMYPNYSAVVNGLDATSVIFVSTQSAATDNKVEAADFTGTYVDTNGAPAVSVSNGNAWFYDLPANVFSDPEMDVLTYKAFWVDGMGATTEITAGSGGNAALSFDPATLKFTGDGTALPSNLIRVQATDAAGSNTSVTSDFALYLSDGVNDTVNVATVIPDQTWDGEGTHSYRIPAETFHYDDLQHLSLTLAATLADDSALPAWLSFDATTGVFSGNPPQDAPASLSIKVSATSNTAGMVTVTDTFTLNLTNPNDAPVVSTPLGDQTSSGSASWSLNVGTLFTDPDGNADGTATTSGITYTAELTDGNSLPSWLSFDGSIFSGNPPSGVPYLNVRVIGTDAGGDTTSTTFTLDLGDSTDGAAEVNSSGTITISDVNGATLDLGDTVTAAAPTDADGYTPADVVYQWQVSSDGGTNWSDIDGETSQSYVTTQSVSGKDIRVQAFYNDDGGFAESPVSNVLAVPTYDVAGGVTVTGALAPGQTLNAVLTDSNGLTTATPTYTWYRGDNPGDKTTVVGGNYSSYTLVNDDGGKYLTVEVSYTDDEGTAETVSDSTDSAIQLGVVAPVANNDVASATEASGIENATAGTDPTGNVLTNDTDANDPQAREVTSVRAGNVEGIGSTAFYDGSNYIIGGQYGTLSLAMDGSYTYTVSQFNFSVEALAPGDSLVDHFNYSVTDDTGLSDIGVLSVTVNGANDAPSIRDVPEEFHVTEDVQSYLSFPAPFSMTDPDSDAMEIFTVQMTVSQGNLWGDAAAGITVNNAGTSVLSLSGSLSDLDSYFNGDNVSYLADKANLNTNDPDGAVDLTMSLMDGSGNTIDMTPSTPIDIIIDPVNDAPIGVPTINGLAADGRMVSVGGTIFDIDGIGHKSYVWYLDGVAVSDRPNNSSILLKQSDVGKQLSVETIYTDVDGTTERILSVDNPRVGNLNDEPDGDVIISGIPTEDQELTVSNTLTDEDGMGVVSYQWLRNGEVIPGATDTNYALTQDDVGAEISVRASYVDGFGQAESVTSSAVTVANTNDVPKGAVSISGTPAEDEELMASNTLTDEDGMGDVSYQWLRNGEVIDGATGDKYVLTQDDVGADVSVRASYTDGQGTAEAVTSLAVAVGNTNDAPQGGVSISGTPDEGEELMASNTLSDEDGMGDVSYQWLRNGEVIDGATGDKYVLTQDDVGADVSVRASYTDGQGTAESVDSNALTVSNTNDAPQGEVTITGTPDEGEELMATHNLSDEDGLGDISYQWLRNGEVIDGATGDKYLLTQEDVGADISVRASYVDTFGAAESVDSGAVAVSNTNDAPQGEVSIAGTPSEREELTASNTLSDEDGMGDVSYQWLRNGEVIEGATGPSYLLTQDDVGADISVRASYVDGFGTSESVDSAAVAVDNTNDSPQGEVTIAGTPTEGEELTASNTLSDEDGMGDVTYQWLRNGEVIDGATGPGYLLTQDDVGADISVRASYVDGQGTSETVDSDSVAVDNTNDAPQGTVTISGTPSEGEELTASNDLSDEDGMGEVGYQWLRNGEVIDGATGPAYVLTQDDVGADISVRASYVDGQGTAESVDSSAVSIDNTNDAPQGTVTISGTPAEGEELSASNDLSDEDGLGDVSYQWLRNGEVIDGATGPSYLLTQDDVGADISVRASYVDGQGTAESVNSSALSINNTNDAPQGGVSIGGTPAEGEELTASNDLSDGDGMGEVSYQWLRDGEVIDGATGPSYLLTQDDVGAEITVRASYVDGQGTAEEVVSTGVTVENTNDAPQGGVTISGTVAEGEELTASNDLSDEDGMGEVSYQWLRNGEVIEGATGASYLLTADDVGAEISVRASYTDGQGSAETVESETQSVAEPLNQSPVFNSMDAFNVDEDEVLNAALVATDPDSESLIFTLVSPVGNGTLVLAESGEFVYTPDPDFNGVDSFVAQVSDGDGGSIQQTFNIDVNAVDDAPSVAGNAPGEVRTRLGETSTIELSDIFQEADGEALTYTFTLDPEGELPSWITFNDDGSVVFTAPTEDTHDAVTMTITAEDENGNTVTHQIDFFAIRVLTIDGMEVEQIASSNHTDLDILPVTVDRVEDPETENETLADIPLFDPENPDQSETLVSMPLGVGISARSGNGAVPRDQAIGDLITHIKETSDEDDADRQEMIEGGESYLDKLPESENLYVSRITLTADGEAPSEPIRITSQTSNADEGETETIPEAFVIDVRGLPSGTVINLEGIEFAVIIGDATVTGGNGRNIVYGNEQSQVIVLGEDDDELYGGSGDDTVGSEGGDDLIFGEAGNDLVFGGAGEDLVHGGLDDDVARFDGNLDDYNVVFNHASVSVTRKDDETDTDLVVNAETLRFADQDLAVNFNPVTETFAWLYDVVLDRQADLGGLEFYVGRHLDEGVPLGTLALEMLRSQEFTSINNGVAFDDIGSVGEQVETLYQHLHGRSYDVEGYTFWVNEVEGGMQIEAVIEEFMTSQEMQVSGQIVDTGWDFFV